MFAFKKISDMFSRYILRDYEHISDQNNHFHRYWTFLKIRLSGLGKSPNANICEEKNLRYVFVGNFDGL